MDALIWQWNQQISAGCAPEGGGYWYNLHYPQTPTHKTWMRDTTSRWILCVYHKGNEESNHIRLTLVGKRINYPGDCGAPTSDLLITKIMLINIISTTGAKVITMDVKNFYLNAPLKRFKYLCLQIDEISEDVKKQYKLKKHRWWVCTCGDQKGNVKATPSRTLSAETPWREAWTTWVLPK